ncbi:hypothetical protein [Aliikangiella sp. IMCC44359]|uniref:hypothetical protein n=1 Tax=Aliikangiella sp. IMCC44359 TaxID=3459125 RepID=UPI00403AAF27
MEINLLKEVIECLDDGRRLVHYYRDKYAVYLLRMLVRTKGGLSVNEIKSGAYAKLLNKDIIKKVTAQCGKGLLTEDILLQAFSTEFESYVVTLSTWGNQSDYLWNQTSRPGANLVIQLNFSREQE